MSDIEDSKPEISRLPLTIREALRLVEQRAAYATILIESEQQTILRFAGGRMLTTDDNGQSVNLIEAIASGLVEDCPCWVDPLWETPDADNRPTAPIGEALAAAVRLAAASATLGFSGESRTEEIIASSILGTTAPGQAEPANVRARRVKEADRMRADFFERRSSRLVTAPQTLTATPAHPGARRSKSKPVPRRGTPAPSARKPQSDTPPKPDQRGGTTTVEQGRRTEATAVSDTGSGAGQDAQSPSVDQQQAPGRRTALRSLIRNLRS